MSENQYIFNDTKLQEAEVLSRLNEIIRYAHVGISVNGVTHDINNFLGAVMAYTELISLDEGLCENSRNMLEDVIEGVVRCSQMLGNLTALARKDLNTSSIIDISELIHRALGILDYGFKVDQIRLERQVESNLPSICGETPRLQLCLGYILVNAQEALAASKDKRIRITATRINNGVKIAIWNSSLPVPEENKETMFKLFFTSKTGPHLGLGLNMAQTILVEHGGTLSYDDKEGFILFIPLETTFHPKPMVQHQEHI